MQPRIQADPIVKRELEQRGVTEKTGVFGKHKVQFGSGSPIRLDEIKGNRVPFQGFRRATKVDRSTAGLAASARGALDVLKAPGALKAAELLAALKTAAGYAGRMDGLGLLAEAQRESWLWVFAPAVEALSNADLASAYQTFVSSEMDLLQTALRREGAVNDKAEDARSAAAQLFDLQALLIKEMSNRVSNGRLDDLARNDPEKADEYDALRPLSLSLQYAGRDFSGAAHVRDITASNLHTLADVAAQSATLRERTAVAEARKMAGRGMSATPKEIGDLLRASPLTVNIPVRRLLQKDSFVLKPDEPLANVFHLQERGVAPKGEAYMVQRDAVERLVFPELEGHAAVADERPVYGALNTMNAATGPADSYGKCVIVLKPEVARRATFVADDTFFAPPLEINQETRAAFYSALAAQDLSDTTLAALLDPESDRRKALDAFLDAAAASRDPVARFLDSVSSHAALGLSKDEEPRFVAAGLQAFGSKEAVRSRTATYDNLESLLFGLDDLNGAALAAAAERRARGLDPSVRLCTNYIEAQIHGPLVPSRDIQEIRVHLDDDVEQKELQELQNRMNAFAEACGVKVVYVSPYPEEFADAIETVRRIDPDADAERTEATLLSAVSYFAEHVRPEAEEAFRAGLENAQTRLRALAAEEGEETAALFPAEGDVLGGSALRRATNDARARLARYFAQPTDTSMRTPEEIALGAVDDAFRSALRRKAEILRALRELPLNDAQRTEFSHWVRNSAVKTAAEAQVAFRNASTQASALRTIADAEPPLSLAETLRVLAEAAGATDAALAEHVRNLPEGEEYGVDDKNADLRRAVSLGRTLLEKSVPALSAEKLRALDERLNGLEMRTLSAQIEGVVFDDAVIEASDYGSLTVLSRLLALHVALAEERTEQTAQAPVEPEIPPASRREMIRNVAPDVMRLFDEAHPAA